ncbi:MAG: immune inhibitor A domain-containing protein [Candidatus Thermoplasmatota archaeon]|nr:immune inhibitor A domain-containing protein [Candidatus Thermoplasmatota archaeon]
MRTIRVIFATLILLSAGFVHMNPDTIESLLQDVVTPEDENEDVPLVGLQNEEHWLVVIIEFPQLPTGPGKDIERVESILTGVDGADDYIAEMSGGLASLNVTIVNTTYSAESPPSAWGTDTDGSRDVASDGSRPSDLAEEAVINSLNGMDLAPYDLNSDGILDRLLFIHTGRAQEVSGRSSDIWSHFQRFTEPITIDEHEIHHYTMASFQSGLGTILHEMLHQMGALDLYDVHELSSNSDWNGVGDWDIMASGNWNGNGRIPALPMAATLDLIGVNRTIALNPTMGIMNINLTAMSAGGRAVTLQISPNESVYVENRADYGFDRDLPGSGLLVSIRDDYGKDLNRNEVNTDPDTAYLRLVEADGDDALLRGVDSGSPNDPFGLSTTFGNDGILIHDRHGRLVDWNITVQSVSNDGIGIIYQPGMIRNHEVLPPRSPIELLPSESIPIIVDQDCNLTIDLLSTDGREVILASNPTRIEWITPSVSGTKGYIRGNMVCGNSVFNVDMDWRIVPHRIADTSFEQVINHDELTTVVIPLDYDGDGQRSYDVSAEGPLERIFAGPSAVDLSSNEALQVDIDPKGLLTPNMYAEGTLHLTSDGGDIVTIEVILYTSSNQFQGLGWIDSQADLVVILLFLLAMSILPGRKQSHRLQNKENNVATYPTANDSQLTQYDDLNNSEYPF